MRHIRVNSSKIELGAVFSSERIQILPEEISAFLKL